MSRFIENDRGFSLIELTIAIIIIGIIVSIALQSMTSVIEDTRRIKTEREMELLANAIVGDANIAQSGGRSDFGYVGDIGSFPPNLSALYSNPGGYSTWDGPYIPSGFSQDSTGLKTDEWGAAYNYSGGVTITSTGSGQTITKKIARTASDYVRNKINGAIRDGADSLPGNTYKDSVDIEITFPGGGGSRQTKLYHPDAAGSFTLDSIPTGTHPLRIIYTPNVDTLFRYLTVYPRHKGGKTYKFASIYFSGGGGGGGGGMITIRPMGTGDNAELNNSGCSDNWQCLDETTSDDDASYVESALGSWKIDEYAAEDPPASGTIDSLIIYMRVRSTGNGQSARTVIFENGNTYYGTIILLNSYTSYTALSTTYAINPATSSIWTWSDINNIQIGVRLQNLARCTQVWAEVFFTN